MSALRRAWEHEHGSGSVVGLAPAAVAPQVLADDLGIATENTAKWWEVHQRTGQSFRTGQLVIVDEASLAGSLSLDRITALAVEAGAKVLLVGDYAQLQSVEAGRAFSLLVHDRDDAPELIDVHRFTNPWEKTASLGLRRGRTEVVDAYMEHDRVTGGETEAMIDAAYAAWRADRLAGRASVLVSDSNESVLALNRPRPQDTPADRRPHPRSHRHHEQRVPAGARRTTRPHRDPRRRAPRCRAHRTAGMDEGARRPAEGRQGRRNLARTFAAYRDRYGITGPTPLGALAEKDAQRIDAARARAALDQARDLARGPWAELQRRPDGSRRAARCDTRALPDVRARSYSG